MPFYPPTTSYTDHELQRIVEYATRKAFKDAAMATEIEHDMAISFNLDCGCHHRLKSLADRFRALAEEQADG